ncbi:MAG: DEAD/DEAH box helicase family protein [Candidatus Omnitrophica bacterium]|nr:DEAD/DEAH box helicase family protein [Candidatus Omnitrophota bacterium]
MNFKSLQLKKAYNSDEDDIIANFYVPALESAIQYKRLTGYFTSSSLAVAACGILGLLDNGGTMQVITSPQFSSNDIELIKKHALSLDALVGDKLLNELKDVRDDFIKDHLFALGWMLANKRLEIKVAVLLDENNCPIDQTRINEHGIFHQKVGILTDREGNIITFSGSINETGAGWAGNDEEFKVFRSWCEDERPWIDDDIRKFNRYWDNAANRVQILSLPLAVEKELIKIAPDEYPKINLARWYKSKAKKKELFLYQKNAIEKWDANGKVGIFEMATGTGKTFTALGCVERVLSSDKKIAIIISCPYNHLVQQWKREIEAFGLNYDKLIIVDGTNASWKKEMHEQLAYLSMYGSKPLIIITTHRTLSSAPFRAIIGKVPANKYFLIADEVHGIGAEVNRKGLLAEYGYRLALSATPKRWFDDIGTDVIYKYFKNTVFEFSLKDAIAKINPLTGQSYLCPYYYSPRFVSLTEFELEQYIKITFRIINLLKKKTGDEDESRLSILFIQRANIIKNAANKYSVLKDVLEEIKKRDPTFYGTIVYTSPQQIREAQRIVNEYDLQTHTFTVKESAQPHKKLNNFSEREIILDKFAKGDYQVLMAMKCLDEGVDIPPARNVILMSNSKNPREYIQRIGRVIRQYPGKKEAYIYDLIVKPSKELIPKELRTFENKIYAKELERCEEIAKTAQNGPSALRDLYK